MTSTPVKDFISLFKAGVAAQVLLFLSIPIILEKYSPTSFGEFTVIISIATLMGIISSLRLERALVVEADDILASLLRLCLGSTLTISIICFAVLFALLHTDLMETEKSIFIAVLGSLYCLLTGVNQIISHMAIRESRSTIIGRSDLLFAIGVIVLLWFVPNDNSPTLVLMLVYTISKLISLFGFAGMSLNKVNYWRIHKSMKWLQLRKYTHPVWTTLLSNLQFRGIYYLSGISYGIAATGNISLSHRVMYSPVNLIGTALRRAYFREFTSHTENQETINHHISLVLKIGSLLAMGCYPLIYFLSGEIAWLVPEQWQALTDYLLVLYPAASILVILSWLDRVYDARGLQHKAFVYELAYTLVLYLVLMMVLGSVEILLFLKIYTLVTVLYNLIWAKLTLQLLDVRNYTFIVVLACHLINVVFLMNI